MHELVNILTKDGISLEAFLFNPLSDRKGVILICPGLGIPKEFYNSYCEYMQQKGYSVLIFDYRGLGDAHLKDRTGKVKLSAWAEHDIPSCIDWLKERYPNEKLYFFGHSVGGQIAGLVPNFHLIHKAVFFCSTGGYFTLFDFPVNVFSFIMFYIQIPLYHLAFWLFAQRHDLQRSGHC